MSTAATATVRFAPKSQQQSEVVRISDCGHYVMTVTRSCWVRGEQDCSGRRRNGYFSGVTYDIAFREDVNADPIYGTEDVEATIPTYREAVAVANAHAAR